MYIIISFYSGEANKPEVVFCGTDAEAIKEVFDCASTGREITAYKQDEGAVGAAHITHICGKDLRKAA